MPNAEPTPPAQPAAEEAARVEAGEAGAPPPAAAEPDGEALSKASGDHRAGRGTSVFPFRQPSLFTAGELRKLRLRHDAFARSLSTRLGIFLRMETRITVSTLETCGFGHFLEQLPTPSHLTAFKVEPLEGLGLIEMPAPLGLTMVDRMLGGPGQGVTLERDLTEIEVALVDESLLVVLREWAQEVAGVTEPRIVLTDHETNARFLQIAARDTSVLTVTLQVELSDRRDVVHVGFPYTMLEPVVRQLTRMPEPVSAPVPKARPRVKWNPALNDVKIPVVAQWEGIEVPARKLAQLKVGDLLPLDLRQAERTRVCVANQPKFMGRAGHCGGTWAIELTELITS